MNDENVAKLRGVTGGAFGAGLMLILLPSFALYFGLERIGKDPIVGLPLLAVFGIMILFGALALISAVFARLGLSDATQALALPEGSIRAAIALSLIVLFAIIAIMLFRSLAEPYIITGLAEAEKAAVVKDFSSRVLAVVPEKCARSEPSVATSGTPASNAASGAATAVLATATASCQQADMRFSVVVRSQPGQESTDLAKQLLILIGTLMTSVTSFYFASRAATAPTGGTTGDESTRANTAVTGVNPGAVSFVPGEPFKLKFAGTGLDVATSIQLQKDKAILAATHSVLKRTGAECSFMATEDSAGVWTIAVVDGAGRVVPQAESVTLTKKTP